MIDRVIGVLIVLISLMVAIVAYPADPLEEAVVPPPTELGTLKMSSEIRDNLYLWTAWDANTEPDLKGYKIHYGRASGDYLYTVDVPSTPSGWADGCAEPEKPYDPFKPECCEFRVDVVGEGIWYFSATAYDEDGNESAYSEELVHNFIVHVPKINPPTGLVEKERR